MSTAHYSWTIKQGGVTPDGAPVPPAESLVGIPQELSGNLPIGETVIEFIKPTKTIYIFNVDGVNNFEVSFDEGINWLEITSSDEIKVELQRSNIILRSIVADVAYHIIVGLSS